MLKREMLLAILVCLTKFVGTYTFMALIWLALWSVCLRRPRRPSLKGVTKKSPPVAPAPSRKGWGRFVGSSYVRSLFMCSCGCRSSGWGRRVVQPVSVRPCRPVPPPIRDYPRDSCANRHLKAELRQRWNDQFNSGLECEAEQNIVEVVETGELVPVKWAFERNGMLFLRL